MIMKQISKVPITLFSLALCACGGSDGPETLVESQEPEPVITEAPDINQPTVFRGGLVQPGADSVERFIKNGVYATTLPFTSTDAAAAPIFEESASDSSRDFSTTNTQEQGVDEADRIEYDGDYMYVATYPIWTEEGQIDAHVRVMQRNDDFSLTQVNELALPSENSNIQGIYHFQDRLAAVGSDFQVYAIAESLIEPWFPYNPSITLSIYDVESPADATSISNIEIDGWLLSSRRIEDAIYVVSSYVPSIESLEAGAEDDETKLQNYLTVLDTPDESLLPQISIDGASEAMNSMEDCYIPEEAGELDGYAQLVTVTRINLNNPQDIASSCMSLVADVMYASEESIYLTSSYDGRSTVVHKIALEDLSYQASGEVTGVIGWRGPANLRLSEYQDALRIVTSDYSNWQDPVHYFSVLQQDGNQLEVVANLPNDENEEPIGKPGEDIYAVRFLEDRGYIVTFERIDPLYVLDLADPLNPSVAGSLEIPGFSSYLHPIGDEYVLGVGQDVTFNSTPANGEDIDDTFIPPVTINGMKVSLFDVRDPATPIELGSVVKKDAYTPVEYDYRALSVLQQDEIYKFAMPSERWQFVDGGPANVSYQQISSLIMLEVNTDDATLAEITELQVDSDSETYVYSGEDRSVLHGDHVFYLHGNQIWQAIWEANTEANGPY